MTSKASAAPIDKLVTAVEKLGFRPKKWTDPFKKHEESKKEGDSLDDGFKRRVKDARKGANRLKDIFAAPLIMQADWVPPYHPKSDIEAEFINDALKDHFVFEHLGHKEKKTLVGAFESHVVPEKGVIIKQNDVGDYFYVIQKGTVKFQVNGADVGTASSGKSFGELALLYDCPRAATCIAMSNCVLWRVDQETFRRILAKYTITGDDETKDLLKKVSFLKELDDKFLTKIAMVLTTKTYEEGDIIMRKGDKEGAFVIIKEGQAKGTDIEIGDCKYDDIVMGPGDHFGERLVVNDSPAPGTVTALSKLSALCIEKQVFRKVLGDFSEVMLRSQDKFRLMAMPLPGQETRPEDHEIDALASLVVDVDYTKGHTFFTEGNATTPALFLMRKGQVSLTTTKVAVPIEWLGIALGVGETKIVSDGGYFGNDNLRAHGEAIAKYTATAISDCTVGVLTQEAAASVLGRKKAAGIAFEDLQKYRILGAGTFGKVWLVSKKGTKDAYALKVQNKRALIEYGQAEGVIRERNIMARLHHPFIISLVNSYQDEKNIYMLTKLYQGGELHSVMHTEERDGLPEWAARFYAAGVLEGLSHMHRRHILYRDLKPENVLLDSDGYTVIVDLGFAKIVPDKTYTFCGTPLYIAPEVVLQRGHDKGADHWSWGVMLYEMIVGMTPFYDDPNMDQTTLFKRIIKGRYEFPSGDFMSSYSKDLIKRVLVPDPTHRIGSFAAADIDIKRHLWFNEIEFDKLAKKEIKAPWSPKIKDPLDVSNFENWDHLEEEDPDEKPLSAKEQKLFAEF